MVRGENVKAKKDPILSGVNNFIKKKRITENESVTKNARAQYGTSTL